MAFSVTTDFVQGTIASATEVNTNFGNVETRYDMYRQLHSGSGTTTSSSSTDIDTHTFSANDFAEDDMVIVEFHFQDLSSGGAGVMNLRITDGSGSVDTGVTMVQNAAHLGRATIAQRRDNNTDGEVAVFYVKTGPAITPFYGQPNLTDANWITTAWTLTLRGNVNTGGTLYYDWKVYKVDHE